MKTSILTAFLALLLIFSSVLNPDDRGTEWGSKKDKFKTIYKLIQSVYPDQVNGEKIIQSSIRGLLSELDPHSVFLDPVSLRSMIEDQQGNYHGLGLRVTKFEDRLTVIAPIKDTPAFNLGIEPGDEIVAVDGRETAKLSIEQAMRLLRGVKGSRVHVKIKRFSNSEYIEFDIERAEIPHDTISYSLFPPGQSEIAYVNIRTFGRTTPVEFKRKVDQLNAQSELKGLIIDLRGNNGGSLRAAIEISDFFLTKGKPIVSIKGRVMDQSYLAQENDQYEDLPLVILINRGSASASEIVAAALKEHGKATIIGTRSWGKGLVQTVYALPLESAISLTTAKYYTPENKCLQRDYSELESYFFLKDKNYDRDENIQGGVIPDTVIPGEVYPRFMNRLIVKGLFFRFSRLLIAEESDISTDFRASENHLSQFHDFLVANNIPFRAKNLSTYKESLKYEIEREVLGNKFSPEEGAKVYLRHDPITRKALEILTSTIQNKR